MYIYSEFNQGLSQMHVEVINLEHRELLEKPLKKIGCGLSDYSFANIYLFRNSHLNKLIFDNKEIFIQGKTYDGLNYIMPIKHPSELDFDYLKNMIRRFDFMFPVPESWLGFFPETDFQRIYTEAESDYIYEVSQMVSYAGNKLHKKHNLLKQFIQGYENNSYPLVTKHLSAARDVLESWQAGTGLNKTETDYFACLEAINMNEPLVLCGMVYYVNAEPAGFILGEELTPDIFDVKFAKAKTKFKGIYQYLFNDLARLLPKKYTYFNFEEDMGLESLKLSKSSYQPCFKKLKYRISLI